MNTSVTDQFAPQARTILSRIFGPMFWLVVQFALLARRLAGGGQLEPQRVPDTVSYEMMAGVTSLRDALSGVRTYGYPLFLKSLGSYSQDYSVVPIIHLVLLFLAVLLFYAAIREFSGSSWLALATASPLLYSCALVYIKRIGNDAPGMALAIAAVSLLLLVARRPGSAVTWMLLAVVTFLAYQMRPDNLFLVALLPIGGIVLLMCRRILDPKRLLRLGAGLVATTVVPMILFMALRWGLVDQFGLVPFGGYSLIGITASFLDRELIRELPQEQQGLATAILRKRVAEKRRPVGPNAKTTRWHQQYSDNIWLVSEPTARRLLTDARPTQFKGRDVRPMRGEAVFTINKAFKTLSREIILRRPILYLRWVYDSLLTGLGMVFRCGLFGQLIVFFVLSVPFLVIRACHSGRNDSTAGIDRALRLYGISLLITGYFFVKLLATVLVNAPVDRYVFPSMIFLPCVLAASTFEAWRWILSPQAPD